MNKAELIDALAEKHAGEVLSKAGFNRVLDTLGEITQEALADGDEVTLPGIGKLTVKAKAARVGRNPRTGEAVEVPARYVPKFSAAKALKDAVA